jgi:mlo protein
MKKTIFEEQTANALMKWRRNAKEKTRQREEGSDDGLTSGYTTPSRGMSPAGAPAQQVQGEVGGPPERPNLAAEEGAAGARRGHVSGG